jgi:hypothetical protein
VLLWAGVRGKGTGLHEGERKERKKGELARPKLVREEKRARADTENSSLLEFSKPFIYYKLICF